MAELQSLDPAEGTPSDGGVPEGSIQPTRQAADREAGASTASRDAQPPTDPSSAPEWQALGWKSIDDAHRDYKNLQSLYGRTVSHVNQLGDLTDVQQRLQMLDALRSDPDFLHYVEQRLAKESGEDPTDPQSQAKAIVRQLAREEATKIAQEAVAPLQARDVQLKLAQTFAGLDKEFGSDWRTQMPKMSELYQQGVQSGHFSPAVDTNFDYRFVRNLYLAVRGADPEYAAQQHAKRLQTKQQQTTQSTPGTAPAAVGPRPIKTFEDAFLEAKRELGMG